MSLMDKIKSMFSGGSSDSTAAHDHDHEHAGHEHAGHDHAEHDHAGHDHAQDPVAPAEESENGLD